MDEEYVAPEDTLNTPTPKADLSAATPEFYHLADFLNVKQSDRAYIYDQLLDIYKWGEQKTDSKEREDVLLAIKDLVDKNGWRFQGKVLIKELYRWIRLDNDKLKIEKQQKLLERWQPDTQGETSQTK